MKKKIGALVFSVICLLASQGAFSQAGLETEAGIDVQTAPLPAPTGKDASAAKATLQPAGQIVWVKGRVQAIYPDQPPRILARGNIIYEKDTIVTGTDGSGQIAFTDNGMITLSPNTTLIIEQYYFNQNKPTEGSQSIMNLVKGGFRTITGFVAKSQPANYQLKTPVATIGVRGTDFQGACPRNPGECAFALLHGIITLSNATGSYTLNPQTPYASVASYTTKAILSKNPFDILGVPPNITPANAPPPGTTGVTGGNCGILIN